jgi:CHASE2 domain-containing sensor protein
MNDFFTWEMLATLAGCSLATGVLTQFLKSTIKIPTQWLSYIIAVTLLFAATLFTGGLTLSTGGIIPLNAVIVALSSNGAYSAIVRTKQE